MMATAGAVLGITPTLDLIRTKGSPQQEETVF
jgi:hypothetical protein